MNGIKLNQNVLYVTLTYGKPFWRKLRKRKIRRVRTPPRRLTTAEIERRLELLKMKERPDDNENERKPIKICIYINGFFLANLSLFEINLYY